MRKKIIVLSLVCGMAVCMLTPSAHAVPAALHQAAARTLAASLRADLQIADQQPELSPLVNSTHVLLDMLEDGLKKGDVEYMRYAVEQYADDMRPFRTEAIDPQCLLPLAISLNSTISSMLGIVSGGGAPLCVFINLSNAVADLLSATLGYQICVVNGDFDNATDNTTLVQKQLVYRTFGFTTSVMNLLFCKRPLTSSDFASLLFELLGIIPRPT